MEESVRAAVTLLLSRTAPERHPKLDILSRIDREALRTADIHVHFPVGAVPKDGPSAGLATVLALASAFADVPIRRDLACTGEITLR